MATLLEKDDKYEKQLMMCTLCKQELNKPKLLPCQHSFCTQCLGRYYGENGDGKPLCCPSCQREIELEDGEVESLPDNYLYGIIKETDGQGVNSELKCVPCYEGDTVINATHKCLDCGDTLCQHCSEYHCRLTVTKHHVVVALADILEGKYRDEFSKRKVLYCHIHSTKKQKVQMTSYCEKCKCLVCTDCIKRNHVEHKISYIQLVRERQQTASEECVNKLEESQKDQDKRKKKIQRVLADTKQKWGMQEVEIYDTATELYDLVDKIKNETLEELKRHYEKEIQYLNELLELEQKKESSLQATVAFTKMFLEKSSDSDFLYHEDDVRTRMEAVRQGASHTYKRNHVAVAKEGHESLTQDLRLVFGKIRTHEQQYFHKFTIGKVKKIFQQQIDMSHICGISYNCDDGELLVAGPRNDKSKKFNVFDEAGLSKRIFLYDGSNKCSDIEAQSSNVYAALYSSKSTRRIVMMDHMGTVKQLKELPADDQATSAPLRIAADDDKAVFITSEAKHRIYKWDIKENSLTTLISQENNQGVNKPSYICLSPSGQLVVSNIGSSYIQVFSKEGELQWQYDGKEDENDLKAPRGICCDEDSCIYVLDMGNCKIHVLNDKKIIGSIPIDGSVKLSNDCMPLIATPGGDLVYGCGNTLAKVSFWE